MNTDDDVLQHEHPHFKLHLFYWWCHSSRSFASNLSPVNCIYELSSTPTSHQPGSHQGCIYINQGFSFAPSIVTSIIGKFGLIQLGSYWCSNSLLPISLGTKSDNVFLLFASIASYRRIWLFFAVSQHVQPMALKALSAESATLPSSILHIVCINGNYNCMWPGICWAPHVCTSMAQILFYCGSQAQGCSLHTHLAVLVWLCATVLGYFVLFIINTLAAVISSLICLISTWSSYWSAIDIWSRNPCTKASFMIFSAVFPMNPNNSASCLMLV